MDTMLTERPKNLCILYSIYQPVYDKWRRNFKSSVAFQGIPSDLMDILKNKPCNNGKWMVIADDLQQDSSNSPVFLNLITAGRHVGVLATFVVWHAIFTPSKYSRILNQNMHAYFLMKSCRLFAQVGILGNQLGIGGSKLKQAYSLATQLPYSYLLVDMSDKQQSDGRIIMRSNCFLENGNFTTCYD